MSQDQSNQSDQTEAVQQINMLFNMKENYEETTDKVLERGENADNDATARLCNQIADFCEQQIERIDTGIEQIAANAGLQIEQTVQENEADTTAKEEHKKSEESTTEQSDGKSSK